MSEGFAGFIGFIGLLTLLILRVPVAVSMGVVGVVGMVSLIGLDSGLNLLRTAPWTSMASYDFAVVPLFMLMGNFCFRSGVSEDLFQTLNRWLGHFRGGLALASVGACAGFAAVSGSSLATAATMGSVALPEMKKLKYSDALSTGVIAAGGTMGILIPPSTVMVIYGILTEQDIGKLFLAGVLPGLLQAVFYMVTVSVVCRMDPTAGPAAPPSSFKDRVNSLKFSWPIVLLFSLVIGGIYKGWFSPSEAAGVGAVGAFVIAMARGRMNGHKFSQACMDAVKSTAMITCVMVGAMILGYFFSVTRLPFTLAETVGGLDLSPGMIMALIVMVYVFLGCVMIPMAMVVLTIPIVYPLITSLGFDPIWFGVITVRVFEIAQITPPVGMNVFVIKGVAPDVPLMTVFRGVWPFFIADIVHLTLLLVFPIISLWLPSMM